MGRQCSGFSSHICLILVCNLLLGSSYATSPRRVRSSRSTSGSAGPRQSLSERLSMLGGPCRCVPDQWEAVMRSVERDVDLQEAAMSMFPAPPSGPEDPTDLLPAGSSSSTSSAEDLAQIGEAVDVVDEIIGLSGPENHRNYGQDFATRSVGDFTASDESTTSIYYDYTARRMALVEHHQRGSSGDVRNTKTISDHKTGVRYVISSDGECRTSAIRQTMKRMCLPAGVTLSGKFNLGTDLLVSLWTATGPNNSTLRTAVDRRRCVPVYEETFTLEPDYLSLKTTFYTNVRLGIKDPSVFTIPPACQHDSTETASGPTSDTKRKP